MESEFHVLFQNKDAKPNPTAALQASWLAIACITDAPPIRIAYALSVIIEHLFIIFFEVSPHGV